MAGDPKVEEDEKPKKSGKKGMLIGVLGAVLLGGGGFYATYSGMILGAKGDSEYAKDGSASADDGYGKSEGGYETASDLPDIYFIEMDPLVISLGSSATAKFLRFSGQLDVDPAYAAEIELIMPRITDALNTYLRAVSEEELAKPSSFDRLRAQMLRRIQVVTGQGKVRDLLITEFILG